MNLFDVYPLFNIEPVKGLGCKVWDKEGNEYLDLYGGHAVISIGHSHPRYVRGLQEQTAKLGFYSNSVEIPQQIELAQKLGDLSGYPDYSLFLCNSGAEANENALKLASFHTGRKKIIACKNSFHGRTSLAVEITDNQKIQAPVNHTGNVVFIDLDDTAALERELKGEEAAAFIVEGIQGIAGIYEPSAGFLQEASALCKRYGTVMILDEIQSGYGRTGRFFAHQYAGIKPGLITLAKGMGNGFPVGGVMIGPEFKASHGLLGTTFGGSHLACAACIAVLDVMKEEDLIGQAGEAGKMLLEALGEIPGVKEVRGKGLMIAVELEGSVKEIRSSLLFDHKIFTGSAKSPNVLRLLPPLCISKEDCSKFVAVFKEVMIKQEQHG